MLCQNCGKREATFHYKSNDNGHISERHLCSECAKKEGYSTENSFAAFNPFGMIDSLFSNSSDSMFEGILGNMLGSSPISTLKDTAICPKCGMRFSDFRNIGRLGCSECYSVFSNSLYPTIKQIHGNTRHSGKFPEGISEKAANENKLKTLKNQLEKAIEKQEYEQAAHIRDAIRELESKQNGNENPSKDGE